MSINTIFASWSKIADLLASKEVYLLASKEVYLLASKEVYLLASKEVYLLASKEVYLLASKEVYLLASKEVYLLASKGVYLLASKGVYLLAFKEVYLLASTVYPKKYAHGFVVLCFVVVMQSFIMNSHEVFIHIHQGCFAGTGAIVRLPQCQWSKPDGYGKISRCITTTKHSKAKTVCIFLGTYCKDAQISTWQVKFLHHIYDKRIEYIS